MEKVNKLRKLFKRFNIDGYIVPKNDEFFNEYIPPNKDRLKFISNFSGSFGFAIILRNKNYLFIDGRYTLQALKESAKQFNIKVLPKEKPQNIFKDKYLKIGFDPKLFTSKNLSFFFNKSNSKAIPIKENLIDYIWIRKKKTAIKKFYTLPNNSVGLTHSQKINKLISEIRKKKANLLFITSSENNAWLLNMRGYDVEYSSVPLGYMLLDVNKQIKFFCDLKKISTSLKRKLNKVKFIDIKNIDFNLADLKNRKIIFDKSTCSIFFEEIIKKKNYLLNFSDPVFLLKAIKNKHEIENIKKAHIYDGVALTKYLLWLKKNFLKNKVTEISGEKKLYSLRRKNKKFKFSSFPTISGAGPNAAIIHYRATKKTNRRLKRGDIYLVDSGGQYLFGTTDVTRTICLGSSKKRVKNIFTRVLKGHIAVTNFKLKKNSTGSSIDYEARKYLKRVNLDYAHGTGHGVGYFLNVHEGPQAISKNNKVILKKGMVVSNEPGYYEKNNFGIRIENLIYVDAQKSRNYFKNFTFVPIDKDLIDFSILNEKEKDWLNRYHKEVFLKLKNFMSEKEILELRSACSAI